MLCALLAGCGSDSDPRVSSVAPVVFQYSVKGMHCQGCVDAITDKVTHIKGVVDCRVNLQDNSATVAVRDASIEPEVKNGIERLGYTVSPYAPPPPAPAPTPIEVAPGAAKSGTTP